MGALELARKTIEPAGGILILCSSTSWL